MEPVSKAGYDALMAGLRPGARPPRKAAAKPAPQFHLWRDMPAVPSLLAIFALFWPAAIWHGTALWVTEITWLVILALAAAARITAAVSGRRSGR
jgi:hypothetical protein